MTVFSFRVAHLLLFVLAASFWSSMSSVCIERTVQHQDIVKATIGASQVDNVDSANPIQKEQNSCADPCHVGQCHWGHCSFLMAKSSVLANLQFKAEFTKGRDSTLSDRSLDPLRRPPKNA